MALSWLTGVKNEVLSTTTSSRSPLEVTKAFEVKSWANRCGLQFWTYLQVEEHSVSPEEPTRFRAFLGRLWDHFLVVPERLPQARRVPLRRLRLAARRGEMLQNPCNYWAASTPGFERGSAASELPGGSGASPTREARPSRRSETRLRKPP